MEIITVEGEIIATGGEIENTDNYKNVATEQVQPGTFKHFIEVQGTVESDKNIFIPAETPGIVRKINVDEGDKVTMGQILAVLDGTILERTIEEIELNLDLATTVYERQKRLWDQNIGSEIQYLQAKNAKENMERRLATVNEQYDMTKIKSPISGLVDEIVIKEGEMAMAGFGAIRVVQYSDLIIKANISEKYIHNISKGDSVYITIPGLGHNFANTLDNVSQVINPDTRTFSVEVDIPKDMINIRHNMLAVLNINDYTNKQALTIPANAVQDNGREEFIFIATKNSDNWIASKKVIKPGKYYNNRVEILENLLAGDRVITVGYQDLANGQIITVLD